MRVSTFLVLMAVWNPSLSIFLLGLSIFFFINLSCSLHTLDICPVWASLGSCNKLPQLASLKQQTFILSQAMEARSWKSRTGKRCAPFEALGKDPSCLSQLLATPGVPSLVNASFQPLPPSWHDHLPVCVQISPFYKNTSHWVRAPVIQCDVTFTWSHVQRPYFLVRLHTQVAGVRTWTFLVDEPTSPLHVANIFSGLAFCFRSLKAMFW